MHHRSLAHRHFFQKRKPAISLLWGAHHGPCGPNCATTWLPSSGSCHHFLCWLLMNSDHKHRGYTIYAKPGEATITAKHSQVISQCCSFQKFWTGRVLLRGEQPDTHYAWLHPQVSEDTQEYLLLVGKQFITCTSHQTILSQGMRKSKSQGTAITEHN